MKKLNLALRAIFAFVVVLTMGACSPDPETQEPTPEPPVVEELGEVIFDVKLDDPTPYGAEIIVEAQNVKEFTYIISDSPRAASVILEAGKNNLVTINKTDVISRHKVSIIGLESEHDYKAYFAYRQADNKLCLDVVEIAFTTVNFGDNIITLTNKEYNGVAFYVQIPELVKQNGNALRYSTTSLAMFNYIRSYYGNIEPDMLLYNAGQYTTESRYIYFDEEHNYERDENGNIVENGAEYSDPKVPGEPGVFLVGEFAYMGEDETEDPMYPAGWDPGYYRALFDWEKWYEEVDTDNYDYTNKKYWTGYFERFDFMTVEPQVLETGVHIEVSDLTPINACVTITPTDDIIQYCVLICTESEFNESYFPLIDNNPDHLRWFVGSYFAMMSCGVQTMAGTNYLWLGGEGGWFLDTKGMAGQTIKVMVAGLGNNDGTIQSFDEFEFTLPEVTLPKPVIEVSAIKSDDPYSVAFNIKNPNYDTNPVTEVKFACNYVREYDAILKSYSYTELLKSMGYSLTKAEIELINSKNGFDFIVSSRDNETTRLAILAYNWEGSGNDPDAPGSPAVCENKTPNANYPVRVNSELFDKLAGQWTASAPMRSYVPVTDANGNSTGEYTYADAGSYSSNVTISAGVDYPETLPQSVYDLYTSAGFSKSETNDLYDEFKDVAKWYNNRTRGFNRLLCLGFNFASKDYLLDMVATPYDLFTAKDYSVSKVSYMFYDFGPKWNLEIDADGSVWLPIDIEREYPLEAFNFGLDYTFYMLGVGEKNYIGGDIVNNGQTILDARFPVEVSADYNTITIKPIVYKDSTGATETFYPCVAQLQYGMATPLNPRVCGNIVLKRTSASTSAVKVSNPSVGRTMGKAVKSLGKAPVPMQCIHSMTPISVDEAKMVKQFVIENPVEAGAEAFRNRADAYVKSVYNL